MTRLAKTPSLAPRCVPRLLEFLAEPWSAVIKATAAEALFARAPNPSQKRKAMQIVLAALTQCPAKDKKGMTALADVVSGSALLKGILVDHIDRGLVHEVGTMLLNQRYGQSRAEFTYALRKIGNRDAISYLEKAAADREMASHALAALRHLREDSRTLALCEQALRIPQVAHRAEIQHTRDWIQSSIGFDTEKAEVDAWLHNKGIKYTLGQLYDKPALCPDCVPQLLELLKKPFRDDVHIVIADALFRRKPNSAVKRKAIDTIIARIEKDAASGDTENSPLSILIVNEFAENCEKDRVHEIGRMMLDKKYGDLRGDFTMVLCKIGSKDAISYLQKGAADPEVASLSLFVLARMRVGGTLELCEKALANPRIRYKDAIKETYQKLKRRLASKPAGPSHATSAPIPSRLEEWSSTVDLPELSKVLRSLSRFVERGFGKAEIAEIRAATDELEVDDTARFKFDAKVARKTVPVWIEVFMDDENAPDLYIFSSPELIGKLDRSAHR